MRMILHHLIQTDNPCQLMYIQILFNRTLPRYRKINFDDLLMAMGTINLQDPNRLIHGITAATAQCNPQLRTNLQLPLAMEAVALITLTTMITDMSEIHLQLHSI